MKMICRFPILLPVIAFALAFTVAIASNAPAADPGKGISATSKAIRDQINLKAPDGCSHIYGFNYQPSWGHNGLTVWGEEFDGKKYREELAAGKKYFPKFNAVRMWLSWSAYRANPERFLRNFQAAVDICGELEILVVPVVFNRWPGNPSWDEVHDSDIAADFHTTFTPYISNLVTLLKGDQRILAWDLCNEPPLSAAGEIQWIGNIRNAVTQIDPNARTCVGTVTVEQTLACAEYSDIITPHLYLNVVGNVGPYVQLAKNLGKPLISTECCWGSLDDAVRTSIVEKELTVMMEHRIGFFPHALYESRVADLHRPQYGPVEAPGYMAFIHMDGSLRAGHDVYNRFTNPIAAPEGGRDRQAP